jgi:hypothetical protein
MIVSVGFWHPHDTKDEAALGRSVGRGIRVALLAGDGGDVDDSAIARLHHVRHDGAAAQEGAGEVGSS